MPRELEIIGALAATGLVATDPGPSSEKECANCGAPLSGRFCAACGQPSDDHHRSIVHLAWEAVEGVTHLDGRIARTLPLLLFNPGRLARDHFEGRRARHIPPFRLFLMCLLLFMLVLEGAIQTGRVVTVSPNSAARAAESIVVLNPTDLRAVKAALAAPPSSRTNDAGVEYLRTRVIKALDNPEYYKTVVFTWAHRLAFLLLPINAAFLTILYIYKRRYFIYDHLVTSMIFLAFVFLIFAAAFILPDPARGWAVALAFLWTPVNLFTILRGAYGSRISGAVLKTAFLSFATLIVFFTLLLVLLVVGLTQI